MSRSGRQFPAVRNAVVIAAVAGAGLVALVLTFRNIEGPVEKCERLGGQMLTGPGGELACLSARTFLPLESYHSGPESN